MNRCLDLYHVPLKTHANVKRTGQTSSSVTRWQNFDALITFSLDRCELKCSSGTVSADSKNFEIFFSWSKIVVVFTSIPVSKEAENLLDPHTCTAKPCQVAALKWQLVLFILVGWWFHKTCTAQPRTRPTTMPFSFSPSMSSFFLLIRCRLQRNHLLLKIVTTKVGLIYTLLLWILFQI